MSRQNPQRIGASPLAVRNARTLQSAFGSVFRWGWWGVLGCLISLGLSGCAAEDFIIPPAPASETGKPTAPDTDATPDAAEVCYAVVNVHRLNVRQAPSRNANVLDMIERREQYHVLDYSADGQWVQLQLRQLDRTGWAYKPLMTVNCTMAGSTRQVVLNNLAHRWSQGEILTGSGYVPQATSLYAQPSLDARVVGAVSPDRLLVIRDLVQDASGVRWARVWLGVAEEPGEMWILADRVIPLPATLEELYEADTTMLGIRVQILLYEQVLRRFTIFPPSDGGRSYRRDDYLAPSPAVTAECDVACAFLRDHQQDNGAWYLPYEDRYTRDATEVVVAPLVPFYEVHVSEGWLWNDRQRQRYALENAGRGTWVLMSPAMRHKRGVLDPGTWLPENHVTRCRYAVDWITVKEQWQLAMDEREQQVLTDVLSLCDDQHLTTTAMLQLSASESGHADSDALPADSLPARVHLQCDARHEMVIITNPGANSEYLAGWHLHDAGNVNRFTLPPWILQAGASVTVTSGEAAGDIHLTDALIWNNNGDTVYLYDASYQLVAVQDCA